MTFSRTSFICIVGEEVRGSRENSGDPSRTRSLSSPLSFASAAYGLERERDLLASTCSGKVRDKSDVSSFCVTTFLALCVTKRTVLT